MENLKVIENMKIYKTDYWDFEILDEKIFFELLNKMWKIDEKYINHFIDRFILKKIV